MVILLLDPFGQALDLGVQLEAEGHDVLAYVTDGPQRAVGDGLLSKPTVTTWSRYARHVDMIFACSPSLGIAVDPLRKKGFRALGGTAAVDRLCYDVGFLFSLAKSLRIKVPRWAAFEAADIVKAIAHAEKYEPLEFRSDLVDYISRDKEDMGRFLRYVAAGAPGIGDSFMLHESVAGHLMNTGGWFNGYKFCKPVFDSFPVGRGGLIGHYIGKSKLFNSTLARLTPFLKAAGFIGYIEGEFVIRDGVPYLFDIYSGFKIPSALLQMELIREDIGGFLWRLSEGSTRTLKVFSRWGCGILVGTTLNHKDGLPVDVPNNTKHIHLLGIRKMPDGLVCTGVNPAVMVTGHAREIDMAIQRAKEMVDSIDLPGKDYMPDISNIGGYEDLKAWGFIK